MNFFLIQIQTKKTRTHKKSKKIPIFKQRIFFYGKISKFQNFKKLAAQSADFLFWMEYLCIVK